MHQARYAPLAAIHREYDPTLTPSRQTYPPAGILVVEAELTLKEPLLLSKNPENSR